MKNTLFMISISTEILLTMGLLYSIKNSRKRIWPPLQHNYRGRYVMLVLFNAAALSIILLGIMDWGSHSFPFWLRVIGAAFWFAGMGFALWAVFSLKLMATLGYEVRLISTGPYRISRNPQYLGFMAGLLGWGLATSSVATLIISLSEFVPLLIVPFVEEPWLESRFGEEYQEYKQMTPRFLGSIIEQAGWI
ncbi:MAG: isoprenylcysteine carboxylmethyltransferase family protein [Anaerolineales bacterium]|nr:isoprenylcysteine carboxylmethyltransferase family protein [Anaerolineales bacterium]